MSFSLACMAFVIVVRVLCRSRLLLMTRDNGCFSFVNRNESAFWLIAAV